MLNPFLPFVYVLPTDEAIDWDNSSVSYDDYIKTKEVWQLRYRKGKKPWRFHIRRLSFSDIQESLEFTDTTSSKLYILNKSIAKITSPEDTIYQNDCSFETFIRDVLDVDAFLHLADVAFEAQKLQMDQYALLKISAWNNTKELDNAMQVPCGCALLIQADNEIDRSAAAVLREEAPAFQKEWCCAAYTGEDKCKTPSEKALSSLVPISNLTKVDRSVLEENIKTCPKYLLSRPWISEAIQYYNWMDKSQLNVLFANPNQFKQTIKDAVDAIAAGINRFQQYHNEQLEQERKRNNEQ